MSNFEDVKTFMETFGQMVKTKPQFPDEKTMQLRCDLIKEELNELEHAMKTKNLKEVADVVRLRSEISVPCYPGRLCCLVLPRRRGQSVFCFSGLPCWGPIDVPSWSGLFELLRRLV